ncbi:ArsB/NhaD family transporter [Desulfosporosinus metallidurans]|uniref:Arsenic efflux pump protein n=1 Tax=Desulfosporosinus metallidurans TaxID=1888891 RepID=A0A1Q8QZH9_9FIRM|nr:ArsB/NhaD family transporter [Desulfosporosinus metallidurans]OLN32772.1 Arsenic efflux pump protein [Desulfosporosinus metallidurans]
MPGLAMVSITIIAFMLTIILILWRPNGLNEAIPATAGAILVVLSGSVSVADLGKIGATISSAAITIIATIVMANVLGSFGFFYWAAEGLASRAKGSGIRLFWYVNLICFLMTLFFNNDGSILITTPILLILLDQLRLKNHDKIPYLISGALIATASSAPIGVSNIVNLIALKIVGMTLYMHTAMMFVPATLGLLFLLFLLFLCFYRRLPRKLPLMKIRFDEIYMDDGPPPGHRPGHRPGRPPGHRPGHPPGRLPGHPPGHHSDHHPATQVPPIKNRNKFMRNILLFVFFVRMSLFVASYLGVPIELVAVLGSLLLLGWRWVFFNISPSDLLKKTPWHIFVFAFSMYVIIYGLNNIGLTSWLIRLLKPLVLGDLHNASLMMGALISLMSIFFNNHPALLIGTLTLSNMQLDPLTLKIAYLASVIGSDVGSLLLPIGTLASLIWMHILKEHNVKVSWKDYVKITIIAIPPTVLFTLIILPYWVEWIYKIAF